MAAEMERSALGIKIFQIRNDLSLVFNLVGKRINILMGPLFRVSNVLHCDFVSS